MFRIHGDVAFALFIFAIIALTPAQARMYRWIDDNGQAHYSDRVPPQYADKERKVYNEEGLLITTVNGEKKKQPSAVEKNAEE